MFILNKKSNYILTPGVLLAFILILSCGGGNKQDDVTTQQTIGPEGIFQANLESTSKGNIQIDTGIILPDGTFRFKTHGTGFFSNTIIFGKLNYSNNEFSGSGTAIRMTNLLFPSGTNTANWIFSEGKISGGNEPPYQKLIASNYSTTIPDQGKFTGYTVQFLNNPSKPKNINNISGKWLATTVSSIGDIQFNVENTGLISGNINGEIVQIYTNQNAYNVTINHSGKTYKGLAYSLDQQDSDQFLFVLANNDNEILFITSHRPAPSTEYPSTINMKLNLNYSIHPTNTGGPVTSASYSGNFPPGLTLNNDGSITGSPNTLGAFIFSITTRNASGESTPKRVDIIVNT